jgi:hypothetical protein
LLLCHTNTFFLNNIIVSLGGVVVEIPVLRTYPHFYREQKQTVMPRAKRNTKKQRAVEPYPTQFTPVSSQGPLDESEYMGYDAQSHPESVMPVKEVASKKKSTRKTASKKSAAKGKNTKSALDSPVSISERSQNSSSPGKIQCGNKELTKEVTLVSQTFSIFEFVRFIQRHSFDSNNPLLEAAMSKVILTHDSFPSLVGHFYITLDNPAKVHPSLPSQRPSTPKSPYHSQ